MIGAAGRAAFRDRHEALDARRRHELQGKSTPSRSSPARSDTSPACETIGLPG